MIVCNSSNSALPVALCESCEGVCEAFAVISVPPFEKRATFAFTTFMTNITMSHFCAFFHPFGVFNGNFEFFCNCSVLLLCWEMRETVVCLCRLWLCAITPLVWRTRLELRGVLSISQRTGSLHGLHPTTTSPTDPWIRYQCWAVTWEERGSFGLFGLICHTYWMLFEIMYCYNLNNFPNF